jgi:hypothetical protein
VMHAIGYLAIKIAKTLGTSVESRWADTNG